MDFGDRSDNPFSAPFRSPSTARKQALKSALRFFLLVGACLAVTLAITSNGKGWLMQRLMVDFDSLTSSERQARLVQISDLGAVAIPALVKSLADPDIEVGRTGYELLQRAQNDWTVLEQRDRSKRYAVLIESLESIAVHLPDDRTGWATSLLQQTVIATVARSDDEGRTIYQDANHAMELLSLSDRTLRTAESDSQESNSTHPRRLTVRAKPLPVSQSRAADLWTQWPPASETRFADTASNSPTSTEIETDRNAAGESPSVYRSGAKLRAVPPNDQMALADISAKQEVPQVEREIQQVTHLVESPLETFDDQSVMRWLGSEHAALREKARVELIRRGYGDTELSTATQIVSANTQTRLELVDAIAQSSSLDPRPWLLMLLDDPSRDVKLRVVSVLATMNDPSISHQLRLHLADERDPTVAARIRRVLKLR